MDAATPGMAWREIAKSAYMAYGFFICNEANYGGEMPPWDILPAHVRNAWEAAVRQAGHCLEPGYADAKAGTMLEERWAAWVPPKTDSRPLSG